MKHKNKWRIFGVITLLLIGFSLMPIVGGAFFEQLDWNNFLGAYQPLLFTFLPIILR